MATLLDLAIQYETISLTDTESDDTPPRAPSPIRRMFTSIVHYVSSETEDSETESSEDDSDFVTDNDESVPTISEESEFESGITTDSDDVTPSKMSVD